MRNYHTKHRWKPGLGIPGNEGSGGCSQLESPRANHAEFVICDHTIDITYVRLHETFIYLAVVLDVYTRMVRGWYVHRTLDHTLSLNALRQALRVGTPEIHHSDQGLHYAAPAYVALLREHGIRISMAAQGRPEENGYAERIMRTIKEEEVDLSDYDSFQDARQQLDTFIGDVYNRSAFIRPWAT